MRFQWLIFCKPALNRRLKSKRNLLPPLLLLLVFLFSFSMAQDKINQTRTLLKQLEKQIEELHQKILDTKRKEANLQMQIQLIDHEMSLILRSKGLLEKEIELLKSKIANTRKKLATAQKKLARLKALYAARAIYSYKYGKIKNIELLLNAQSINQALIRLKYLQQIARHDENLIHSIEKEKSRILKMEQSLEKALQQKNTAYQQIQLKTRRYLARKNEKQQLLRKLKRSHYAFQNQLRQKDRERQQLLDIIAALEKERLEKERQAKAQPHKQKEFPHFNFENFRKAKGKLPWPVKGKIITPYGLHKDPVFKTAIKNTYIEIKAQKGTPVRCIFPGVVRVITYLPDYGNTIIIDHGKGYYSIYSHLGEIYVYKNDPVKQNQIIAKVGDSGYIGQSSLRFSIYSSKQIYNPTIWLE